MGMHGYASHSSIQEKEQEHRCIWEHLHSVLPVGVRSYISFVNTVLMLFVKTLKGENEVLHPLL